MTKKEKKGMIILIIAAIVLIIIVVKISNKAQKKDIVEENTASQSEQSSEKYTTNLSDGTKINSSDEFKHTKKYKDIEISNIQFTYQGGNSVLLADAKNTSSIKHESEIVKITILDENNNIIEELFPVIPSIQSGETKQLNIIISGIDSVNAKDFKIEEK